ncbi:MAG: hypothetical protein J5998_05080 [Clostridia bacterium]|nr:hypothetical protein [Clostridia bacterium]
MRSERECDMGAAWRDFPRPLRRLDGPARERLTLAALLEKCMASHPIEPAYADLRRALAGLRRRALERALSLCALLPVCRPVEEAIRLEQLEADLTAALRAVAGTGPVRPALDFALLEETDQLYRFANLLDAEQELPAERVTGGRAEITPGRPCIAAHRHPYDSAFRPLDFDAAPLAARLTVALLAPLERHMASLYVQRTGEAADREARALFAEMALIEEQHASQYESLWDPRRTALENLPLRAAGLCYAYRSLVAAETNETLRGVWRDNLAAAEADMAALSALAGCAPTADFPPPFLFGDTSALARDLMPRQVTLTMLEDSLVPSDLLPAGCRYFAWQRALNGSGADTPSHCVVRRYAARYGTDYRFERKANPIEALQNRRADNIQLGCEPLAFLRRE